MFNPIGSPQAFNASDHMLKAVEDFEPRDQLAAAGWAVIAVLGALRERFETTPKEHLVFDLLCSETQAWLRRETEALRFAKAN